MAAAWAGYEQEQFFDLSGDKQSYIVALYDLNNQIEGVISKDQSRGNK